MTKFPQGNVNGEVSISASLKGRLLALDWWQSNSDNTGKEDDEGPGLNESLWDEAVPSACILGSLRYSNLAFALIRHILTDFY